MNPIFAKLIRSVVLTSLVWLCVPSFGQSRMEECPVGFVATSVEGVCQQDSSTSLLVYSEEKSNHCAKNYERISGLKPCFASDSVVDIANGQILLTQNTDRFCRQAFSREWRSKICSAQDLLLEKRGQQLIRYSKRKATFFDESKMESLVANLPRQCPPGFLRPPSLSFCIAEDLVYLSKAKTKSLGLPDVDVECPEGFARGEDRNFCVPRHTLPQAKIDELQGHLDVCITCGKGEREGWDLVDNGCPIHTTEVWWEVPIYDADGLFVEGYRLVRYCLPDDLTPAG